MSFVKKRLDSGTAVWKLYNDSSSVKIYPTWDSVMQCMLELQVLPTVLVYEKVTVENHKDDLSDKVSPSELYKLEKQAKQLQQFIDQFENQAAAQM